MNRVTKALLSVLLALTPIAALAAHIKLGHHRVLVENGRETPISEMTITIANRHDTRSIGPGELITSSFANSWPKDAAVELTILRSDGTIEEHHCLYLGFLPQVASIRLLPNGIVHCKLIGPSLLAL